MRAVGLIFFVFCWSFLVKAQEKHPIVKKHWGLQAGAGGSTLSVYRGALVSKKMSPSPRASVSYKGFTFAGIFMMQKFKRGKNFFLLGANYYNDDMFSESKNLVRQQRLETYDTWVRWIRPLSKRFQIHFGFHQDVRAHWGQYLTVKAVFYLLKAMNFSVLIGGGSLNAHRYIYGLGAEAGLGHMDPGLEYQQKVLPWGGELKIGLIKPIISQGANRRASYVKERDNSIVGSLSAIWSF